MTFLPLSHKLKSLSLLDGPSGVAVLVLQDY